MNNKVKATIYAGIILWVVAFFQIITTNYMVNQDGMTQAFARNQLMITQSTVELRANLGQRHFNEATIHKVLSSKENSEGRIFIGEQEKNGQNYGHIRVKEDGDMSKLTQLHDKLSSLSKKSQLEEYEIQISVEGKMAGELTEEEKEKLCKSMQRTLGAVQVQKIDEDGYYVCYGYAPALGESVTSNGRRSNVTIALTYDDENDETNIIMGSPLISEF